MGLVGRIVGLGALVALVAATSATAASNTIFTVAGTTGGHALGDEGPATSAQLYYPHGVAATADGGYLIADTVNDRIRRVAPNGTITTVAGTTQGFSGDGGPATAAQLHYPDGVAPTPDGGFLIADTDNHRIRRVSATGTITTVAGGASTGGHAYGLSGDDGPADHAQLTYPNAVSLTGDGGYLIADTYNHRIRSVSATGTITTVAGTTQGLSGDNGAATAAQLRFPDNVTATPDGGYLIADTHNSRIRRVSPGGTITTVAGTTQGFSGDGGPATAAQLNFPNGVAMTGDGGYLIGDTNNARVRRVSPAGTISTVAGATKNGNVGGLSGDGGPATQAELDLPYAVSATIAGGFLVADLGNSRIRFVDSDFRASPLPPAARPPSAPPSAIADHVAPRVSSVAMHPSVFRVATGATAIAAARSPAGARLTFRLSERASVRIAVQRPASGRRSRGVCRKPSKRLRKARRCVRWTTIKTLVRSTQSAGARSLAFSGRIGRKALKPGRYRVAITAVDAANNRSKASSSRFRIVR